MFPTNYKFTAMLSLGVLSASILTAGIAGASQPDAPTTETTTLSLAPPSSEELPVETPAEFEPLELDDWQPSEEEIAEINAEIAGLSDALTEANISFTLETDEFGIQYPEWDQADDEAAWSVLEQVFGDFEDIDFDDADFDDADFDGADVDGDWELTSEEIAQINAEIGEEVKALKAAGIAVTMQTDELGIQYPTWSADQDDQVMAVYEELYGPFDDLQGTDLDMTDPGEDFDLDGEAFDLDNANWNPTPEEIAEINTLVQREIEVLTESGISVTLETDEFGIKYPVWDEADEAAAWDILESFWESEFDELTAGEKDSAEAGLDN